MAQEVFLRLIVFDLIVVQTRKLGVLLRLVFDIQKLIVCFIDIQFGPQTDEVSRVIESGRKHWEIACLVLIVFVE